MSEEITKENLARALINSAQDLVVIKGHYAEMREALNDIEIISRGGEGEMGGVNYICRTVLKETPSHPRTDPIFIFHDEGV